MRAFSLIEMAMTLALCGLVVGFALQAKQAESPDKTCYPATKSQLLTIRTAVEAFARKNDRLPMPADITARVEDITYGREGTASTTTTVGTAPNTASWGAVPFQALGLSPNYAADCWGNKLVYVVTTALTTNATSGGYLDSNVKGNITLASSTANTINTTTAYALVSLGEDGLGAVKANANTNPNSPSSTNYTWCANTGTLASINCSAANMAVADAVFNNGKNAGPNYYDDIIVAAGKPQILNTTNLYCWGTDGGGWGSLADGKTTWHQNSVPTAAQSNTMFASFTGTNDQTSGPVSATIDCALGVDGTAYCWGNNGGYALGDGTNTARAIPTAIGGTTRFKALNIGGAGGGSYGYAIGMDDRLYCWGQQYGSCIQYGIQSTPALQSSTITFQPNASMAADFHWGYALGKDGTAYAWSWGGYTAPKGHGSTGTYDSVPTTMSGGHKFSKLVEDYGQDLCALTSPADPGGANRVYCWGWNSAGTLGQGDQVARYIPTLVPGHTFSNIFQGNNSFFAVGDAADANPGRLYAWGGNNCGENQGGDCLAIGGTHGQDYGAYPASASQNFSITSITKANPATVTTSSPHGFSNGDIVAILVDPTAGFNGWYGPPGMNMGNPTLTVSNVTSTTFQINYDTTAVTGNVDVPVSIASITKANPAVVTTSTPHGFANNDIVLFKGVGGMTQLNGPAYTVKNVTATSFELQNTDSTNYSAYTSGGTVGGFMVVSTKPAGCAYIIYGGVWGICKSSPTLVNNTSVFTSVTGAQFIYYGITSTGDVWGWGGPIGIAGNSGWYTAAYSSPLKVQFPTGVAVRKISTASNGTTCALGMDKIIYCMGNNDNAQVGIGTSGSFISYPTPITGGRQFVDFVQQTAYGVNYNNCGIAYNPTVDCDTAPISWGSCSAMAFAMVNGSSNIVPNTASGHSGSITASCANKVLTLTGGSCL